MSESYAMVYDGATGRSVRAFADTEAAALEKLQELLASRCGGCGEVGTSHAFHYDDDPSPSAVVKGAEG